MKKVLILLIFLPLISFSQDLESRVREKLSDYYRSHFPLKVNLILSRENVFPGDTIFFQAHLFVADQMLHLAGTTVLNVLLKDEEQNTLIRSAIRLGNGVGNGQFILPPNIADGNYVIVSYHDWMKNGPEELYFRKCIQVGNVVDKLREPDLSFHVEGGNLIGGLNNKIVVVGKPNAKGVIKNASSVTVAQFVTDDDGLGFFFLTPASGEKYTGSVADSSVKVSLPEVKADGLTLLTSFGDNGGTLRLLLQAPKNSVLRSNRLFAIVTTQSQVFYSANFVMNDKPFVQLVIPIKNAGPGISVVRIYDEHEAILAERLVAIFDDEPVSANVSLLRDEFSIRDKIDVDVKLTDDNGSAINGTFTASVYHAELPPADSSNRNIINDHYYFGDLDGVSPHLLKSYSQREFNRLNNYLISKKVLTAEPDLKVPYLATDLMLSGKVVRDEDKKLPDSTWITFFFQKSATSYQWLLENGRFNFPLLFDFDGVEEVYYKITDHGTLIKDARVIMDDPYALASPETASPSGFARQRESINRSFDFYVHGPRYQSIQTVKTELEDLMDGADVTIRLDNYILFPTMSETLREIIPSVQHRVVRGRNEVRVFLDDVNLLAKVEPAFVIDGTIVDDVDYFLNLKPADVSTIKVVYARNKIARLGVIADGGIIIVETKMTDHAKTIRASANTFLLSGLTQPLPFKEKVHAKSTSRIPDLRTALYWNPDLAVNMNGSQKFSFYSSDVTGDYIIRIEGLTSTGKPFYTERKFTVRFSKEN